MDGQEVQEQGVDQEVHEQVVKPSQEHVVEEQQARVQRHMEEKKSQEPVIDKKKRRIPCDFLANAITFKIAIKEQDENDSDAEIDEESNEPITNKRRQSDQEFIAQVHKEIELINAKYSKSFEKKKQEETTHKSKNKWASFASTAQEETDEAQHIKEESEDSADDHVSTEDSQPEEVEVSQNPKKTKWATFATASASNLEHIKRQKASPTVVKQEE